jgi:predicted FMN-binding regulatory protein PaiB
LTSCESGKIEVTHLPIVRLRDGKLYGHVSTGNCHANIDKKQEICLIFNGEEA